MENNNIVNDIERIVKENFDGDVREGVLELGNGFFYEPKKYVVGNLCFRLSHIKTLEVNEA